MFLVVCMYYTTKMNMLVVNKFTQETVTTVQRGIALIKLPQQESQESCVITLHQTMSNQRQPRRCKMRHFVSQKSSRGGDKNK